MPPIHHRDPGVIGATSDSELVTVELICEGLHVHPAYVISAETVGSIEEGKLADYLVCDEELSLEQVHLNGLSLEKR